MIGVFHRDLEPGLQCPGTLKPDRYRHDCCEPTRAWRCSVCGQRFSRVQGRLMALYAVDSETQRRLIQQANSAAESEQ